MVEVQPVEGYNIMNDTTVVSRHKWTKEARARMQGVKGIPRLSEDVDPMLLKDGDRYDPQR